MALLSSLPSLMSACCYCSTQPLTVLSPLTSPPNPLSPSPYPPTPPPPPPFPRYLACIFHHAGETGNAILQQHRELIINERVLGSDHADTLHRWGEGQGVEEGEGGVNSPCPVLM